jgi:hypothetical protein
MLRAIISFILLILIIPSCSLKQGNEERKGLRGPASVSDQLASGQEVEEEGEDCLVQRRYIPGLGDVIVLEKDETDKYGCRLND